MLAFKLAVSGSGSTPPNLNVLNSTCKFPLPFYDFLRNKERSTEQSTDKVIYKTC